MIWSPGPICIFVLNSCMSILFVQVINFKMPRIVGILKFMTGTNDIVYCSEQENCLICLYFEITRPDAQMHENILSKAK